MIAAGLSAEPRAASHHKAFPQSVCTTNGQAARPVLLGRLNPNGPGSDHNHADNGAVGNRKFGGATFMPPSEQAIPYPRLLGSSRDQPGPPGLERPNAHSAVASMSKVDTIRPGEIDAHVTRLATNATYAARPDEPEPRVKLLFPGGEGGPSVLSLCQPARAPPVVPPGVFFAESPSTVLPQPQRPQPPPSWAPATMPTPSPVTSLQPPLAMAQEEPSLTDICYRLGVEVPARPYDHSSLSYAGSARAFNTAANGEEAYKEFAELCSEAQAEAAYSGKASREKRFTCKIVFTGVDPVRDADFELVPRLIGRQGCNMREIATSCDGKIALSCKDQASFDVGKEKLFNLVKVMSVHFESYCRSKKIDPVPPLFRAF